MEEMNILKKAGLSEAQATIYNCLLKRGALTPTELAEYTGQSRENCYAVTKRLAELGIIEQTKDRKTKYRALNPSALESLVEKRRRLMAKNEKFVKDNISSLLDIFYANNAMPGAKTLEGVEGIKEVYNDVLRVKKDVYLLRTRADNVLSNGKGGDIGFLHQYRDKLPIYNIHTYALTPFNKVALKKVNSGRDKSILFHRTWMPEGDYTSPVAIQAYGDKVAIISFSEESQMATIITSPVIAEAIRQILKIMIRYYKESFQQEY